MKRWGWLLGILLVPALVYATGTLTMPNTIFTQAGGTNVAPLLDQNFTAIATYVNDREATIGLLASRPTAGKAGRWYIASDQAGGTPYLDNGTTWVPVAAGVSALNIAQRASLTLANNGNATATFAVFPGAASSDDATLGSRVPITLAATMTKGLSAWAVGTGLGCLDTGAATVFTWYHVFIITRLDTGVVDILCSLSATAPTMPTNYTKKQRLGAIRTTWFATAGAEIYRFTQRRNSFRWATTTDVVDVNNATPGTNAVVATLSVPNGVVVRAILSCAVANTGQVYISELAATDEVPAGPLSCASFGGTGGGIVPVYTDTAQSIRYRNSQNVATQLRTIEYQELWD